MNLIVRHISRYGIETFIPLNELALLFCELLRQKTLTRKNIETIKRLGFEIKTEGVKL